MKKIFLFTISLTVLFLSNAKAQSPDFIVDIDVYSAKIKAEVNPQLIDVRSAEEFSINHINNAVNIDLSVAENHQKLQTLTKEKPVFIYSINTSRSGKLAKELLQSGFKEVYVLKGGIVNWIGSNLPYYSSAKNIITHEDFQRLTAADKPVLIEFMSRYCGACKRAGLIIDSLKTNSIPSLNVLKVDINDNAELIAKLNLVHAVPTLVFYKNNTIVWKKEGIEALGNELKSVVAKIEK
jgi:rhodanese-related sulfurtransferase